ncbi:unnamed protein product, partial [Polarella glacialis]
SSDIRHKVQQVHHDKRAQSWSVGDQPPAVTEEDDRVGHASRSSFRTATASTAKLGAVLPGQGSIRSDSVVLHFVCHSLGGLIARAALPELVPQLEALAPPSKVTLGHFLTLSTPHLGVHPGGAVTRWKELFRFSSLHRQVNLLDGRLSGRPGEKEPCCLEKLAAREGEFRSFLLRFHQRTAVAATHWDIIVPFCTAAVCPSNPFPVAGPTESSFWRVDAALGFDAQSSLVARAVGGEPAAAFAADLARLDRGCLESPVGLSSQSFEAHSKSPLPWHCPNDGEVQFPEHMLLDLASVPWRRVAFTIHRPLRSQVHTFAIGKRQPSRVALRWSIEFIDMLLDTIEEDLQHM